MDLGGPKLRTGAVEGGPAVLKLQPRRDAFGRVLAPWHLHLRAERSASPLAADASLVVDAAWLATLAHGDRIEFSDARDARRQATVVDARPGAVRVEGVQTAYLVRGTRLRVKGRGGAETVLDEVSALPGVLHLERGQRVRLQPHGVGHDAGAGKAGERGLAAIGCTLPEALAQLRKGERVWFDDGKVGALVVGRKGKAVELEITHARDGGDRLGADKGINLPDTALDLPALTEKDLQDLAVVARHADLVGLSFANRARDVHMLRAELHRLGVGNLGLLLKIETRAGFEHLPELLLAALCGPSAGVMIARGDLAVECGFERLAEIQEEILWACEAAHVPVVWATQVLETLAKTGRPSRAEVTDAAMGERAECVMLNKGPYIADAMRTLDDILRRMQAHQSKKRSLLRALKAWRTLPEPPGPAAPAA
jgi:pyruvate kinase